MFEPIGGHSSFDTELWRERMEYPAFDGRTFENVSLKADVPLNLRTTGVRVQGQQAEITLADEANVMEVCLMYRVLEDCDVIEKHARLTANAPVRLTRMDSGACLLPHEAKPWTAHYVVGAWAGEFRRRTAKLEEGELRLQSVRGMSGPHMNPFLIAGKQRGRGDGRGLRRSARVERMLADHGVVHGVWKSPHHGGAERRGSRLPDGARRTL